ncbi:DUF2812 domain-containing protein [Streptococcus halotolerans]|uniref:DUF2812 domain-containing protein n=1 Tax=Streptococcus halotolerans TaxID=1814128 RepID=UPI0007888F1C|nr:DUF2812 domain-containing protein [Streptococcus halotolerans]
MRKFKLFFGDIDKEEVWINTIQDKGYVFEGTSAYFPIYRFRRSQTGRLPIVKIDFRSFKKNEDYHEYKQLFNDYGWEHVGGSLWSGEQYFRQKSPNVSTEIFSDAISISDMRKRLLHHLLFLFVLFAMLSLVLMQNVQNGSYYSLFDPKSWYLTPGLWELSGWLFWGHFLFETPFALLRTPLIVLLYILITMAYGKTYVKLKNRH